MNRQQVNNVTGSKFLLSLQRVVQGAILSALMGVTGAAIALPALSAALPGSVQDGAPKVANGVYVFGDAPESGQPGHEYMVIEIDGDRVLGGFYQPASEFSCFTGQVTPTELTLQVNDTQGVGDLVYNVPLYLNNQIAASEFILPYENALGLQGTHRMDKVDAVSQDVLEACRAVETQ